MQAGAGIDALCWGAILSLALRPSSPQQSPPKVAPAKKVECLGIELAPVETKPFELAHFSVEARTGLEDLTLAILEEFGVIVKGTGHHARFQGDN
jgi:hypothetical protein